MSFVVFIYLRKITTMDSKDTKFYILINRSIPLCPLVFVVSFVFFFIKYKTRLRIEAGSGVVCEVWMCLGGFRLGCNRSESLRVSHCQVSQHFAVDGDIGGFHAVDQAAVG
jgi:hypothetical protein